MIKNYFKFAWRNLKKRKIISAINILGLSVGLACAMLIVLFILDESAYDKYHQNTGRIFRVVDDIINENGEKMPTAQSMPPLAAKLKENFSAIKSSLRIYNTETQLETPAREKVFIESDVLFADSTFFDFFSYDFIEGNAATALQKPFSLVLTRAIARKYFDKQPAAGKTLKLKVDESEYLFTVTGVIDESRVKSHLNFNVLGSMSSLRTVIPWFENWNYPPVYTYIMVQSEKDYAELQPAIKSVNKKILPAYLKTSHEFQLQPLSSIHLTSHRAGELKPNSDITYLYVFGIVALLVLVMAGVNFMNLSVAGSISRKKEIGLRKTFGAEKSKLVTQFMGESLLLTLSAFLMAIVMVKLLLSSFNQFFSRNISFSEFLNWPMLIAAIAIIALVTLVAGGYPALLLSSFRPSDAFRDDNRKMPGKAALQKGLVVLQFVISSLLITSAIVVYYQLDFMKNKKLGFQKENILIVPLRDQANQHNYEPLKQRWLQNPSIKAVTATSGVPTREEGLNDFQVKPKQSAIDSFNMLTLTVDHDFVKTYGMEIVAGRDFSKEFITDTSSGFLINESAAKLFGWNDPVNQELTLEYYFNRRINKTGKVVGVVKDFHYHSLRQKMTPLLMHITPGTYYNDFLSVKVSTENIAPVISFLQKEWQAYNPSRPFEYMFLDEYYGKLYKSENRFGSVILLFSLLAIGIACVGLFALVSFVCKQRIKEIGIRKVMGASVGGITALLSKDFLKLALLSAIIASPLAWWAMNKWLQDFAYRIDITWWMLTIAAIAVVLIALVTVSFQAIKAALSNPVKALRSE